MLSPELLQNIAIARLVLAGSVVLLLFLAYKMQHQGAWALSVGAAWAMGAATLLFPAHTLLWGNQGDETFQIAFMERVISGQPFSDFFYANLSPFYPPLYFWIFGTLGRIFNWDGISAAQWGTVITYALLPLATLGFAKLCTWTLREQRTALLLSVATLLFIPTEALLLKPYEATAALLSILWITSFVKLLKEPTRKLTIILGVTGGIIFLLYYFWFVLLIPAMLVLMFIARTSWKCWFPAFVGMTVIVTLIASPFLVPYLINLITLGQENYQSVYFFPSDAHLYAPWASLSILGVVALGSITSYAVKKEWSDEQKAVLALGGSLALWYIVQLTVLALGDKSIMLSKPFLFLGSIALMLPAMEWIAAWIEKTPTDHKKTIAATVIILSPLLPNGLFLDDAKVQTQLEQNLQPKTSAFVAENIRVFVPDYANRTWLVSGLQDLNGILPLTYYLTWNPHFSHPAAHWGTRLEELKRISTLTTAAETTAALDNIGINALLFYKAKDETGTLYYPFFYEDDAWPNGTESKEIRMNPDFFTLEDWIIAQEDNEWRVLLRK